jgi:hypothetical protein
LLIRLFYFLLLISVFISCEMMVIIC